MPDCKTVSLACAGAGVTCSGGVVLTTGRGSICAMGTICATGAVCWKGLGCSFLTFTGMGGASLREAVTGTDERTSLSEAMVIDACVMGRGFVRGRPRPIFTTA